MRNMVFALIALFAVAVAGCTNTEKGAVGGAAAGAVIGGLASGTTEGALIGAAVGGVSGAVIGRLSERPGYCRYRAADGTIYVDKCP